MKASVAVYNSHDDAIHALTELKENGINMKNVSVVGQASIEDDHIKLRSNAPLIASPLLAGSVLGTTLGLLTGIGIFTIPGLGVIFGAGALIGTLGGFEVGAIAGGFASMLLALGIHNDYAVKYEEHIKNGKFLVILKGTEEEIEKASEILDHEHAEYLEH